MARKFISYRSLTALEDERNIANYQALIKSYNDTHWDSTSEIPGTGPEKLIYNYLVKLGLNFEFQYHTIDVPSTAYPEDIWVPDFKLTDYNLLIEVFGIYWHSMPSRAKVDQWKMAYWLNQGFVIYQYGVPLYPDGGQVAGKVVIWWEDEIYNQLDHLFSRDVPELLSASRIKGSPAPYLLDPANVKIGMRQRINSQIASRVRGKPLPISRADSRLKRKLLDINKLNPLYALEKELAPPRMKRAWLGPDPKTDYAKISRQLF